MMHLANLRSFLLKLGYSYCRTLIAACEKKKSICIIYLFNQLFAKVCTEGSVVRTRKAIFQFPSTQSSSHQ